jgi:hypothetical protein
VTLRSLALLLGVVYLGLGVLGLMPGVLAALLPENPVLALVHVVIGAWGLAAYTGHALAPSFARSSAFIFAGLGLAGMLDGIEHGPIVWLHLASAGFAGFAAWSPGSGERRGLSGDRRRRRRGTGLAIERRRALHDRRSLVRI